MTIVDSWELLTLDSHFKRVVGYARTSDYLAGTAAAAFAPAALYALEKFSPSHVGKGGLAKAMRLAGGVGVLGGFLYFYQRSARTSLSFDYKLEYAKLTLLNSPILRCY